MSELLTTKQLPLVDEYLSTLVSEHTKRAYRQDLAAFQSYFNSNSGLGWNSILKQYRVHLLTKYAPLSCNRMLASLKSYFTFLYLNGATVTDASIHIQLFKAAEYTATPGLSDEDAIKLLNSTTDLRDRLILELLFYLGLRRAELVTLKRSYIDLNSTAPSISVWGKGNKCRILPLSGDLLVSLVEYLNSLAPKYTGEYLFPGRNGETLHPNSITKVIKKYAAQAGVTGKVSPHVARATCVSNALEQGATLVQVQQLGGWSSSDMVLRYDKRRQALHNSAAFKVNYAPKYTGGK
jgi:site-specific recombinase XerD